MPYKILIITALIFIVVIALLVYPFFHQEIVRRTLFIRNPFISWDNAITFIFVAGLISVILYALNSFIDFIPSDIKTILGIGSDKFPGLIAILTFLFTVYMSKQIIVARSASDIELSNSIYFENRDQRSNEEIRDAIKVINDTLNDAVDVTKNNDLTCTGCEKYIRSRYAETADSDILKKIVFHYEYLGYLVYYRKINFPLLFDTITCPDKLYEAAKTARTYNGFSFEYLDSIRKDDPNNPDKLGKPDNWNGFEFLYYTYKYMRARDAWYKEIQGKNCFVTLKNSIKYKNSSKHRDCVDCYGEWINHFQNMPH